MLGWLVGWVGGWSVGWLAGWLAVGRLRCVSCANTCGVALGVAGGRWVLIGVSDGVSIRSGWSSEHECRLTSSRAAAGRGVLLVLICAPPWPQPQNSKPHSKRMRGGKETHQAAQRWRLSHRRARALCFQRGLRAPCLSHRTPRAMRTAWRLYGECDGIKPSLGDQGRKGTQRTIQFGVVSTCWTRSAFCCPGVIGCSGATQLSTPVSANRSSRVAIFSSFAPELGGVQPGFMPRSIVAGPVLGGV